MAFDEARFAELARARGLSLGLPLIAVELTGSTNDDAMAAARRGATHGTTFLAEAQTQGRGRRGRRWSSKPGENLTFSVLLRTRLAHERVSALTLAVGLAVRDAVAGRVNVNVGIKWPNDVVVVQRARSAAGGELNEIKKLAGILLESQLQGCELVALVVGIGLNVGTREFDAELSQTATSLALLDAGDLDRESLLVELLSRLDARIASYEACGLEQMMGELCAHDALFGTLVESDQGSGVARGIDEDGALVLQTRDGTLLRVVSGAISPAGSPSER